MTFTTSLIESKIIDFIAFPNCAFITEREAEENDHTYDAFVEKSTYDFFKSIEEELKPYKSLIKKYYLKNTSFYRIIKFAVPARDFDSIDDYLKTLSQLTEDAVRDHLVAYMKLSASEASESLDETDDVLGLIDSLTIEDDEKWLFMQFIRQPKATLDGWLELLKTLKPIFDRRYAYYESKIKAYSTALMARLNETDGAVLKDITGGLITVDIIPCTHFLFSFVNIHTVELSTKTGAPYVLWGIETESVLKRIKEAEADALIERVAAFKNLGDKTRYEVLRSVANGMHATKDIAKKLGVSSATISYHLNSLVTAKLIKIELVEGKYTQTVNAEWLEYIFENLKKDLNLLS